MLIMVIEETLINFFRENIYREISCMKPTSFHSSLNFSVSMTVLFSISHRFVFSSHIKTQLNSRKIGKMLTSHHHTSFCMCSRFFSTMSTIYTNTKSFTIRLLRKKRSAKRKPCFYDGNGTLYF